jgi:hypothetical protein
MQMTSTIEDVGKIPNIRTKKCESVVFATMLFFLKPNKYCKYGYYGIAMYMKRVSVEKHDGTLIENPTAIMFNYFLEGLRKTMKNLSQNCLLTEI